ncbi:glucosamine-6-phosphate deaminase [Martelella alba]|uniref:Glucosamine-6-phosphate deaminase n=1 Tax=Martelella alba TaxID=2590451 RepID=A0A506U5H3_9HYPH|nr:glucosamine-6-phosphate deaminase [Martelella alba]TPW27187.1 glucosamine-6-phosphate deaminase [Martelella alba]
MRRVTLETAAAAAVATASAIIERVNRKPDTVLGLATGATMEPVYAELIKAYRDGAVSFSRVKSFNLDEYIGLPPEHPGSYRSTMNALLFDHVDIAKANTYVPDGMADDEVAAAATYEKAMRAAGGIDLQLLGIGRNGHIGFNEPGSALDSLTRPVRLHESTLSANSGFFAGARVPEMAITMGIGTILRARQIVVLATGAAKADAVSSAFRPGFSIDCPASALNEHGDAIWYLDSAAAHYDRAA